MILVQHIYNLQAILKMATTSESRFYTSFTGNFPSFSYAFLLWNPFDLGKAGLLLVDFAAALTTKLTACTCSCCEAGQQSVQWCARHSSPSPYHGDDGLPLFADLFW
jgi:hypothetical protein